MIGPRTRSSGTRSAPKRKRSSSGSRHGGIRLAASGDRTAGPNDGLGEALTDWSTDMHGSRALVGGAGGGRWPARRGRYTGGSGPRAGPRDAPGGGGGPQGAVQGGGLSHWRR